jgi:hypothetical protein
MCPILSISSLTYFSIASLPNEWGEPTATVVIDGTVWEFEKFTIWRSKASMEKTTHHFRGMYGICLQLMKEGKPKDHNISPVGLGNTRIPTDYAKNLIMFRENFGHNRLRSECFQVQPVIWWYVLPPFQNDCPVFLSLARFRSADRWPSSCKYDS